MYILEEKDVTNMSVVSPEWWRVLVSTITQLLLTQLLYDRWLYGMACRFGGPSADFVEATIC